MTLVSGFRCADGLIICADTQETIAGYTKNDTQKISTLMYLGGCISVAGAGDADLIQMAFDKLVDRFLSDDCKLAKSRETQREIESVMTALLAEQARLNPEGGADFLIGYRAEDGKEILKISGTGSWRVRTAQCLGTGIIVATSLVNDLFDLNMTMKQAALLAIYVMQRAKRQVDGVGGNTDILFIGNYGLTRIPTVDVQRVESWWTEVEQSNMAFIRDLTGPSRLDKSKVATLADFQAAL